MEYDKMMITVLVKIIITITTMKALMGSWYILINHMRLLLVNEIAN